MYKNKINIKVLFWLLLFNTLLNAQTIIEGSITNQQGVKVTHGIALLKDATTKAIKAFEEINTKGMYTLTVPENLVNVVIEINSFGYEKKVYSFSNNIEDKKTVKNFKLSEKTLVLEEVIIESSSPVVIKKDTIQFKAVQFKQGNEENIEDLLSKIPGIEIDNDGKIKYDKREIEKIMVDNEDLFGKGYKLLSKNMPVNPVEEIEVLTNYSNNALLKGVEKSNKVALNLKLHDKYKRLWFGNVKTNTSVGSLEGFYNLHLNLMNFGKKSKHYFIGNFNNTGFETIGDVGEMLNSIDAENYIENNTEEVVKLISFNIPTTIFSKERTNFNNSELVASSSIFNFSEKTKLKVISFFNTDETLFFKNSFNEVNTGLIQFSNTEDAIYKNNKQSLLGKLEFSTSFIPKKDELLLKTALKKTVLNKQSALIFNNDQSNEYLKDENELLDVNLQYTRKINKKKAIVAKANYTLEEKPQNYEIDRFFYQDVFNTVIDIESLEQNNIIRKKVTSFSINYLNKFSRKNFFQIALGNRNEQNNLKTGLFLINENETITPDGYSNSLDFNLNELYLNTKYAVSFSDIDINSQLTVNYLNSSLHNFESNKVKNSFLYINPWIDVLWNMDNKNRLSSNISYRSRKSTLEDVYDNYINTGFLNFSKGTGHFGILNSSKIAIGYEYGNSNDDLNIKTNYTLNKQHTYFSNNTTINQNSYQKSKTIFKDGIGFELLNEVTYYFSGLSTNLKLGFEYKENNFEDIIDDSFLRDIKSTNYGYKIEAKSAFTSNIFNYHVGLQLNNANIKSSTNYSYKTNISFINLYFLLGKEFNLDINSTFYDLSSDFSNSNVLFLDFNLKYKIPKSKITVGLIGKNLLNTKKYKEITVSENLFSTLNYNLLPRYVLLRFDYNF